MQYDSYGRNLHIKLVQEELLLPRSQEKARRVEKIWPAIHDPIMIFQIEEGNGEKPF